MEFLLIAGIFASIFALGCVVNRIKGFIWNCELGIHWVISVLVFTGWIPALTAAYLGASWPLILVVMAIWTVAFCWKLMPTVEEDRRRFHERYEAMLRPSEESLAQSKMIEAEINEYVEQQKLKSAGVKRRRKAKTDR